MKTRKVREIMIPISEYATVSEDASLYDAIKSLQDTQDNSLANPYPLVGMLVYDKSGKICGKISPLDIVRSLEPKYRLLGHSDPLSTIGLSRFGLSPDFLKSLIDQYNLWDSPLEKLIDKASKLKVREFMYTPLEGEFVKVEAPLSEAIHQIVLGHHQSLLVMEGKEIVGVLRLVDIFAKVCELMAIE